MGPPSSRKPRQILIPHGVAPNEVRPTRIERRARLVNAIARGRRWLDEIVSGSVTDVQQIAARQKCSARQVNLTISLAFLAPDLVKAAVEGRLPRGMEPTVRSPRIESALASEAALISVMISTITPWIWFDLVSRKVKGTPVGV